MSWEIEYETDFSDLDCFGNVPISALFFWAQKCRMQVYNSGVLGELRKSTGVLMVKAQTFQFEPSVVEPVKAFTTIVVTQKVAAVGKTSMTFGLEFKIKATGTIFARGIVVMVCVAGGEAQEIPAGIKSAIMAEMAPNGAKLKASIEQEISKIQSGLGSPSKDKNFLAMDVLLRLSDEDANSHVSHRRYVHFFEDALALNERRNVPLKVMSVEYVKETRGGEKCVVEMTENTSEGCARFEMKRDKNGEVVCRGLARF